MQFIRRILYIPLLILLGGALLLVFNVISVDIDFPIGIEWIATIIAGVLVTMFLMDMRLATYSWRHPEPEEPPKSEAVIYPKPMEDTMKAVKSMDEAEDFAKQMNGRVKIAIDIEEDPEEE